MNSNPCSRGPFRRFYHDPVDNPFWLRQGGIGPLPGHDIAGKGLHTGVRCRSGQTVPIAPASSRCLTVCRRHPGAGSHGLSRRRRSGIIAHVSGVDNTGLLAMDNWPKRLPPGGQGPEAIPQAQDQAIVERLRTWANRGWPLGSAGLGSYLSPTEAPSSLTVTPALG